MPLYESVFIARQDISSQQVESLSESLQGIVRENGGTIEKTELWGLRNLAYRIKKNRKGHYFLLNINAPAATMQELERNARLNEDIIRYLSLRVDGFDEGPSIMMQTRSARDGGRRDRGDRGPRGDRDRGPRGDSGPRGERQSRPEPTAPAPAPAPAATGE
ncbi:MAG: 30S ribosomal protein S6 [Alphaproteobacteria bacterium]|jgi:small subunit ribosomal protein S6|nr:30S ribosomal protein S6 [Alphaproteobacteria bacterium]